MQGVNNVLNLGAISPLDAVPPFPVGATDIIDGVYGVR